MKLSYGCIIVQWILSTSIVTSENCFYQTSYYSHQTQEKIYSTTFKSCENGCCLPVAVCCGKPEERQTANVMDSGSIIAITAGVAVAVTIIIIISCVVSRKCTVSREGRSARTPRMRRSTRTRRRTSREHATRHPVETISGSVVAIILPPPYELEIIGSSTTTVDSNDISFQINRPRTDTQTNDLLPHRDAIDSTGLPPYENTNTAYSASSDEVVGLPPYDNTSTSFMHRACGDSGGSLPSYDNASFSVCVDYNSRCLPPYENTCTLFGANGTKGNGVESPPEYCEIATPRGSHLSPPSYSET